jgi:hypothetical protein
MWAFAALYMSAGDKEEVLVVGSEVQRFEQVTSADLERVRVALEPGAESIPVSDEDDFLGRLAATELIPGSILTEDHFLDEDVPVVSAGEEIVAAVLGEDEIAAGNAEPGATVNIVIRGAAGSDQVDIESPVFNGRILHIGPPDEHNRERQVSLVVSSNDSAAVSAASADGRISVNLIDG